MWLAIEPLNEDMHLSIMAKRLQLPQLCLFLNGEVGVNIRVSDVLG